MPTTRQMSDRHEAYVAKGLGGRVTAGSGSTFRDQTDVRTASDRGTFVWAADGKSTLGKSIGVSRDLLAKLVRQVHWARPLLPLRFYLDERLTKAEDWVALRWADFLELDQAALTLDKVRTFLDNCPSYPDRYGDPGYGDPGYGDLAADLLDILDGREPHRSEDHLSKERVAHIMSMRDSR